MCQLRIPQQEARYDLAIFIFKKYSRHKLGLHVLTQNTMAKVRQLMSKFVDCVTLLLYIIISSVSKTMIACMGMRLTYGLCTLVIVNLLFNAISPRAYIQMIHLELLLVLPDCCGLFLIIIIQN